MMDKFSNLPEAVAHHILSFLSITDLTRVGCVSRRCREFYLSTPSLKFDEFSLANTSPCRKRLKLLRSLDTLLILRGNNKIHHFRVHWDHPQFSDHRTECFCGDNEKFRMVTWINYAVRCDVEVLDLDISIFHKTPLAFPPSIFLCKSLRSLSLDMNCMIQVPSFTFSSNLKCLELRNVKVLDEKFFKWISSCCKCIEELILDDVYGIKRVTIESSSLESFCFGCKNQIDICDLNILGDKLETIIIRWRFCLPRNKSLNIFAPNLKNLFWIGNLMNRLNLGEFVCLEKVGFILEHEDDDVEILIEEYLCSFSNLNFLILNEKAIKALFREGLMPAPCDKIHYLRMKIRNFNNDLVPAMVYIFRGVPNLSTLCIELDAPPYFLNSKAFTSGYRMGYWKLQNLAYIDQLKEVTIQLSNASNGVEFARYMLKHALNLEKMVITYLPQHSCNAKKVLQKCKIVSNVTIVFQEKQEGQ